MDFVAKNQDSHAQSRVGNGALGCAEFPCFAPMHKLSLSEKVVSFSDKTHAEELMQSIDAEIKNRGLRQREGFCFQPE